jgi:hypothetical protein
MHHEFKGWIARAAMADTVVQEEMRNGDTASELSAADVGCCQLLHEARRREASALSFRFFFTFCPMNTHFYLCVSSPGAALLDTYAVCRHKGGRPGVIFERFDLIIISFSKIWTN